MEARVKPGLGFIVGVAMIIFIVRLNTLGILGQVLDYLIAFMFNIEPTQLLSAGETYRSAPALISETLLQLVISLGSAGILSIQGVWDLIVLVFGWIGEVCKVLLAFLKARQASPVIPESIGGRSVTELIVESLKRQEEHTHKLAKAVKSEVMKINLSIAAVQDDVADLRSQITKDPSNGSY